MEIIEKRENQLEDRLVTFTTLLDLVAQIDNASSMNVIRGESPYFVVDVHKMGLWGRLLPLFDDEEYEIRTNIVMMVTACAQNNPEAAEYLVTTDVMKRLVSALKVDVKGPTVRRAISAISALFQSSTSGFEQFAELEGLDALEMVIDRFEDVKERVGFILGFYVSLHGSIPKVLKGHRPLYLLFLQAHKGVEAADCDCPLHSRK